MESRRRTRAKWDADQVRDDVRAFVVEHSHDDAPEERGTGYVLAVACSHEVTTGTGKFHADTLARKVPERAWQKLSAGGPGPRATALAALDEHQVRRYPSWSRRVTLAMPAHAFLAVVRTNEHDRHPSPDELLPLTCNEIQRLFITLVIQRAFGPVHRLRWSVWRRRHQARSQTSH